MLEDLTEQVSTSVSGFRNGEETNHSSASNQQRSCDIWLSRAEILALPMSGDAWLRVKSAADGPIDKPDLSNQDEEANVLTLAKAFVLCPHGRDVIPQ